MTIRILEPGNVDSAMLGWMGSRDVEAPKIEEVATIDASVNELPTALFYFEDMTIIERELCVTPRNHVIWARTSRVDDPRNFRMPAYLEKQDYVLHSKQVMQHMHDSGVSQDIWRLTMPIGALTSWTQRLSFRDAIRLVNYLADVAKYVEPVNPALCNRLIYAAGALQRALPLAYYVSGEIILKCLLSFKRIPIGASLQPLSGRFKIGQAVSLQCYIPIALRAQLVRHREITIADNFVHALKAERSELNPLDTKILVQAVALESTWRAVLGKRTCWMAQADLWQPLVDLFGSDTDGLPCAGGSCPYAEDAKQRLLGNDPGAPCPRYANLYSVPLSDGQWERTYSEAKQRPNNAMWLNEIGVTRAKETSKRCPKCNSLDPARHPAVQHEGDVTICTHPFHGCSHAGGCPFPDQCAKEQHCDAKFNGYR